MFIDDWRNYMRPSSLGARVARSRPVVSARWSPDPARRSRARNSLRVPEEAGLVCEEIRGKLRIPLQAERRFRRQAWLDDVPREEIDW